MIDWLQPGLVYDFKGFVRGEQVSLPWVTSNIWLVGRYSGGYAWAGLFNTVSTAGLPDLTPEAAPPALAQPHERTVGKVAANLRKGAGANFDLIMGLPGAEAGQLNPDKTYPMQGYVRGQKVGNTDVWFVSKSGGFVHAEGFTNTTVTGLADLTPKPSTPQPTPTPAPTPAPAAVMVKDAPCVTELHPARQGHFQAGNFPAKPAKIVIHQFHGKSYDAHIQGAVAWFQSPENKGTTSAHFAVEGSDIWQVVSLANRAYHAGAAGNDFIGIETHVGLNDALNERTFWSLVKLIKEIADKLGYMPELVVHKGLMVTDCGTDIRIDDYRKAVTASPAPVTPPTVPVTPAPTPTPTTPPPAKAEPTAREFVDWLYVEFIAARAANNK